jgi:transcriptional regulator with XRE-family HTH domain
MRGFGCCARSRAWNSITPAELARRAKCHRQAIYAYRVGTLNPSAATLRRIASALDLDPADLVKSVDEESPAKPARTKKASTKSRR